MPLDLTEKDLRSLTKHLQQVVDGDPFAFSPGHG